MSETKLSQIRRRNDPKNRATLRKSERTRFAILDAALKFLWTHLFRELTASLDINAVRRKSVKDIENRTLATVSFRQR